MKKLVSFISILVLIVGVMITLPSAHATVSGGTMAGNAAADLIAGTANADYNVAFDTDVGAVATNITITFPVGYTITNGALGAAAVQSATPTASNVSIGGVDVAVTGVAGNTAGRTIIVTLGVATDLSTGVGVSFRILTGVTNPTTSGTTGTFNYMSDAVGEVAQANVAGVLINPVAITDLSCIASGSGGSVWLRWTTPVGTSNGYLVKYSLANITAGNFAVATTFTQAPAWASGTVGVVKQQLVIALTPNNLYFFNIEAQGANASISAIANTVFCTAPTAYAGGASDAVAPTSTITSPTDNQGITSGNDFTITGTSADTGGSSVKLVEISFDGGTTWYSTSSIISTATGFDWNYVWSNPALSSYTIKTRATDWFGNMEVPGDGVSVTVLTEAPAFTVEIGGPPTTTETTGEVTTDTTGGTMTTAQIEAKITELRVQLLNLLKQLLVLLQAQIKSQ